MNFLINLSNGNYKNDVVNVINHYKLYHLVFIITIIMTIIGNSMVVLAVIKNRNLQNTTNYFLMSLAIADMLVAILVMPLSLIYELLGYFPFGKVLCILWVSRKSLQLYFSKIKSKFFFILSSVQIYFCVLAQYGICV